MAARPKGVTPARSSSRENPEVAAWFKALEHPQKETMLLVREAVMDSDPRLGECIKWSTPTFFYEGNLASIQPNAKKFVSLLFHQGAKIPGVHPDLLGESALARVMQFQDKADVRKKAKSLAAVVKAWCDSRAK